MKRILPVEDTSVENLSGNGGGAHPQRKLRRDHPGYAGGVQFMGDAASRHENVLDIPGIAGCDRNKRRTSSGDTTRIRRCQRHCKTLPVDDIGPRWIVLAAKRQAIAPVPAPLGARAVSEVDH